MCYIAFDPGGRTGIAIFNEDGSDNFKGALKEDFFLMYLRNLIINRETVRPAVFIAEGFHLRKDKALDLTGSDMPASRMLGAIQLTATILGIPLHIQEPRILYSGVRMAGIKKDYRHLPDELSAYCHGLYYLTETAKIRKHRIFEES